jgi:iron(II)-dependent oxidoreductase
VIVAGQAAGMTTAIDRASVTAALDEARRRTLALLDPVPTAVQARQVSSLMSPLCWDLAHIGHYEELWLVRALTDAPPTDPRFDDVYDAFRHPRRERGRLEILDPAAAREFDAHVRARALDVLGRVDLRGGAPLLRDGFVYGMVAQHEHQHVETMLATLQLVDGYAHPAADGTSGEASGSTDAVVPDLPDEVVVPAGTFAMGTDEYAWAYDNERPAHEVELPAFGIDTTPVTNRAYAEFVDAGAYSDDALWTRPGREWRDEAQLSAPQFWQRAADGSWMRRRYGRVEPLPLDEPVQHVCWYEADAYARWRGRRLPTEAEWERAAHGAPVGAANLWREGPHRFGPSAVGSRPDGVSDCGVHQMFGDVWEWTSSDFAPYPGFRSFPYREYSEAFFGDGYKVLRGGSWATHPVAMRTTFRNWDFPVRRQIFAGFRCARDA